MKSPFKFLDAFDLRDREVFFGRDEEIDQLYGMIHKNRMVLVYGQSGTGKTSLVQCGLASRFDATDWLPLFVRRGTEINRSFAGVLNTRLSKPVETATPAAIDALYGHYLRPVFLIFDQLEELFILGNAEEQQQFIRTIAELQRAELPCRMLFIIREEYLAALYDFEKTVPSLFDRRLRVEPMSATKVEGVLRQSFERFSITLEDAARNLRQIVDNVSAGRAGIQLPYLQVYLDLLWQEEFARTYGREVKGEAAPDNKGFLSAANTAGGFPPLFFETREIESFGEIGDVLGRFLERQRLELQQELKAGFPELAGNEINRLLDVFVTEEGTKRPVATTYRDGFIVLDNIPDGALEDLPAPALTTAFNLLEKSRLLRVEGNQAELAHDALAALIDQARSDEQRKINEINSRLRNALHEYRLNGGQELPGKKLLFDTQELLDKLHLSPEMLEFYRETSARLKQLENAELEEKERRLEEAERTAREEMALRKAAQLSERRAKRRAYFVGGFAVLAAIASFLAYRQSVIAREKTALAEAARLKADASASDALQQKQIAVNEKERSDSLADYANLQKTKSETNARAARSALDGLENANDKLIEGLLDDAANQILKLDYDGARDKLHTAAAFERKKPQVAEALLEIAYFFNEAGQKSEAQKELTATAALLKKNIAASGDRVALRSVMQNLLPARFKELEARYYPVMAVVTGGTFEMGAGVFKSEKPAVQVTLSKYQTAKTATTVWQYHLFLTARKQSQSGENTLKMPAAGWKGNDPVVNVSWYDAVQYANWLSAQRDLEPVYTIDQTQKDSNNFSDIDRLKWTVTIRPGARGFRLPTEAEWEYAAGPQFGTGNIREWCRDWYSEQPLSGPAANPAGPAFGRYRVVRGKEAGRRSPDSRTEQCGFRLARGLE